MKYQIFVLIFFMTKMVQAECDELSNDLPKYTNILTAIHEIQGSKKFTLHLTFEQNNPIAVYAPESFQECQDKKLHRFILPNTTINSVTSSDCLTHDGDNIEVVMTGEMLLNVVGENFILMTVLQD